MAAKRKTTAKKAIKKAPKKAPKKTAAKASKKAASTRIAKVTPSRDGLRWSIALSDGATHAVSAAAAQSVGLRVGGAWSKATDAKVRNAEADQELFKRAMSVLAQRGRMPAAKLEKALGADARAKSTVAALKRNGWIA